MLANLENNPNMQAIVDGPTPSTEIELRNFVLLTEPMGEKRAGRYLKKRGLNPYLPLFARVMVYNVRTMFGVSRRSRVVPWPIFPGLLFIPLNMAWNFGPIHEAPGIRQQGSKFMKCDGHYRTVSVEDMAIIRGIEERLANPDLPGLPYRIGDKVTILNGPFADRVVEIAKLDDVERIELLMDFLGQKTKIYASVTQIMSS